MAMCAICRGQWEMACPTWLCVLLEGAHEVEVQVLCPGNGNGCPPVGTLHHSRRLM